jgi:uncharacterized protein (TIGR03066 family)
MRNTLFVLFAFVAIALTAQGADAPGASKPDSSKLVGVWKAPKSTLVDSDQKWTFNKDGTYSMYFKMTGLERSSSGKWKIDGKKLVLTNEKTNPPDRPKETTLLIKELTDEKVVLVDGTDIDDETAQLALVREKNK